MKRKRLERLARRLERIRHEPHFQMDTWGHRNECGTSACALGHAAMISEFRQAGLKMVFDADDGGHARICFGRSSDREAGAKFFGIAWSTADVLFGQNLSLCGKAGARLKAKQIRHLLAVGEARFCIDHWPENLSARELELAMSI